jgi:hypothetical protein
MALTSLTKQARTIALSIHAEYTHLRTIQAPTPSKYPLASRLADLATLGAQLRIVLAEHKRVRELINPTPADSHRLNKKIPDLLNEIRRRLDLILFAPPVFRTPHPQKPILFR